MVIAKQRVEEADRLLDELESLARSNATNSRFHNQLLTSLQIFLGSQSCSILMFVQPTSLVTVAQSGLKSEFAAEQFANQLQNRPNAVSNKYESWDTSPAWIAVPIQSDGFDKGSLLIVFEHAIPPGGEHAVEAIARAFAEVLAIRQLTRLEKLIGQEWAQVRDACRRISESKTVQEAASVLVNHLIPVLSAARVSLALAPANSTKAARLMAVSTVPNVDPNTPVCIALKQFAIETLLKKDLLVRQFQPANTSDPTDISPLDSEGTFRNLLGIKFTNQSTTSVGQSALIVEWSDREEMLDGLYALNHFVPHLATVWDQQLRWLKVPKWFSSFGIDSSKSWVARIIGKSLRPLVVVCVSAIAFWFLSRPYPMMIEAESILEPTAKRAIYANTDGFLNQLLVEDGQSVSVGQPVASLRSPILDLQIEETNGQVLAIGEKRNGLRVAINQISTSSPDADSVQTRISGEILLLETQEKHVRAKRNFLMDERKKLMLESPIQGIVVARNLRSEIEMRPLRRGDAIFNIVDLDGDWRLNIRVKDRDVGYVKKSYDRVATPVTIIFDSIPGEQFTGEIQQISTTMENPQGTGSYLQVLASLDKTVARRAYMGANARAFFHCGEQPLWFIWCRPLMEELQKRLWLFSKN